MKNVTITITDYEVINLLALLEVDNAHLKNLIKDSLWENIQKCFLKDLTSNEETIKKLRNALENREG